jgi:hypothetical protein
MMLACTFERALKVSRLYQIESITYQMIGFGVRIGTPAVHVLFEQHEPVAGYTAHDDHNFYSMEK